MTGNEALRAALPRLVAAGVPDAPRDARALLAHAAGLAPDRLTLHLADPLPPDALAAFEAAIDRRAAREPVSHITGTRLFWGRTFRVTADTLDPRPETEILVQAALAEPFLKLLDLGTGTGCVLLSCLAGMPMATGTGTDIHAPTLAVAQDNATRLNLGTRARFQLSDWFAAVQGRFDLIVSNPPYIAEAEMPALSPEVQREPRRALTPGGDGLDAYRAIARGAPARLMPGGRLLVEIGPTQGKAVAALFSAQGLTGIRILPDLDGRDRVVSARKPQDDSGCGTV
ncbi:peptide chain release factor N(5)-glutamine methyltransferase [Paragemmobacter straminiformis]|uniref:Release factor glutamine methyltransferase n=1 Tax=Paragemmobacter straminiformis TaxID=2045119 RepID=A0A842I8R6_9RHOB|nr:peptide chain release factor N(5)-glutamine methyltransferase [Gemmobacter straminiformis]MBC2835388.1 peptide chain release factor N(5)-glutamine methyltransferase [Gemmobacter straminiformis]